MNELDLIRSLHSGGWDEAPASASAPHGHGGSERNPTSASDEASVRRVHVHTPERIEVLTGHTLLDELRHRCFAWRCSTCRVPMYEADEGWLNYLSESAHETSLERA